MKYLLLLTFSAFAGPYAQSFCQEGLESFRKHLYPTLRASCVNCHGDKGDAPGHSVSNVKDAYTVARESIDVDNVKDSYFYEMIENKHWKDEDPKEEGISLAKGYQALTAWVNNGEAGCPQKEFQYITDFKLSPKKGDTKKSTLRFDLSKVSSKLKDTFFEIDIQRAPPVGEFDGAFSLTRPRLTSEQTFKTHGFYILLNGNMSSIENTFSRIMTISNAKEFDPTDKIFPGKVLSTKQLNVVNRGNLDQVKVQIGFEKIELAQKVDCLNQKGFEEILKPQLTNLCVGCHTTNKSASTRFNMKSNLCAGFSERVNQKVWSQSTALTIPLQAMAGHPDTLSQVDKARYQYFFGAWAKDI